MVLRQLVTPLPLASDPRTEKSRMRQPEKTETSVQTNASPNVLRRAWQRPTLQRLHVSLDTAQIRGSGADGGSATTSIVD